jgi:hypothetical protein
MHKFSMSSIHLYLRRAYRAGMHGKHGTQNCVEISHVSLLAAVKSLNMSSAPLSLLNPAEMDYNAWAGLFNCEARDSKIAPLSLPNLAEMHYNAHIFVSSLR